MERERDVEPPPAYTFVDHQPDSVRQQQRIQSLVAQRNAPSSAALPTEIPAETHNLPSEETPLLYNPLAPEIVPLEVKRISTIRKIIAACVILGMVICLSILIALVMVRGKQKQNHGDVELGHGLVPAPAGCPPNTHYGSAQFNYATPDLVLLQVFQPGKAVLADIRGRVRVEAGAANQDFPIAVLLAYGSSDHQLVDSVAFASTEVLLTIDLSRLANDRNIRPRPCLVIDARILVAPGFDLGTLHIEISDLDLEIAANVSNSAQDIRLISYSGSVTSNSESFLSHSTLVESYMGDIGGSWSLIDRLGLYTHSGDITIDVTPEVGDGSKPTPVDFRAGADSGNITVIFPMTRIPPQRDYHNKILARSGSVTGSYLQGSKSTFNAYSGVVDIEVLPVDGDLEECGLGTRSNGHTSVTVLQPLADPDGELMRNFYSYHEVTTGGLTLHYPSSWEGILEGDTMSGQVKLRGKGLRVLKYSPMHVEAWKGDGGSNLFFRVFSGATDITIGTALEECVPVISSCDEELVFQLEDYVPGLLIEGEIEHSSASEDKNFLRDSMVEMRMFHKH